MEACRQSGGEGKGRISASWKLSDVEEEEEEPSDFRNENQFAYLPFCLFPRSLACAPNWNGMFSTDHLHPSPVNAGCRLRVGGLAQRHLRHRGKTRRNDLRVRFRAEFQRHRSAHKQHVYQGCSGESLTRDSRATWFWEPPEPPTRQQ